jgi:hypothetical protein
VEKVSINSGPLREDYNYVIFCRYRLQKIYLKGSLGWVLTFCDDLLELQELQLEKRDKKYFKWAIIYAFRVVVVECPKIVQLWFF